MKCPWCWTRVAATLRLDRDPADAVQSVNGAPFLCHHCKRVAIVIHEGRGLRKPTFEESQQLAEAMRAAAEIPDGQLTVEEVLKAAEAFYGSRKKRH